MDPDQVVPRRHPTRGEHRALGHRTVLITGALDFVVVPLAPLFDDIVSAQLDRSGNRYKGELLEVPPTGERAGPRRAVFRLRCRTRHRPARGGGLWRRTRRRTCRCSRSSRFPWRRNPETRLAALARKRYRRAPRQGQGRPEPHDPDRTTASPHRRPRQPVARRTA
ncbi:MAG: hypothetical protein R2699_05425 [Acidimicrobiales bacterium]